MWPASARATTVCDPMKPAPPVMSMFIGKSLIIEFRDEMPDAIHENDRDAAEDDRVESVFAERITDAMTADDEEDREEQRDEVASLDTVDGGIAERREGNIECSGDERDGRKENCYDDESISRGIDKSFKWIGIEEENENEEEKDDAEAVDNTEISE